MYVKCQTYSWFSVMVIIIGKEWRSPTYPNLYFSSGNSIQNITGREKKGLAWFCWLCGKELAAMQETGV